MSDKTFKQQVEEILDGHCPKETDALYPCPMLDDEYTDCIKCKIDRILSVHNAEVAAKAVKEFAEKVDGLFLSKATPCFRGGGPDRWIITKQDWNAIVRAMAEGKE